MEVFLSPPHNFDSTVDVVICFVQKGNRYLMLKKNGEPLWTAPGGKAETGEDMLSALEREVKEETGITLSKDVVKKIGRLFFVGDALHFNMHIYHLMLEDTAVTLSDEHDEYSWYLLNEISTLKKQPGADSVLDFFYRSLE